MTDKIENIVDSISITEEIDEAGKAIWGIIVDNSLSRRASFFGCIDILMIYGNQKEWNAAELKNAISRYIDLHLKKD